MRRAEVSPSERPMRILGPQQRASLLSGALILALAVSVRAQSQGRAIIEKAIEASGGAQELEKLRAIHARYEGNAYFGTSSAPCRLEAFIQWPSQLRTNLECESADRKKFLLVQVVNREQAWRSENGQTEEGQGHTLVELRESFYFQRIETLRPLLRTADFTYTATGDGNVNNHEAVGVRISSPGHRDITLYFDNQSYLLVKSEHWLPDLTGREVFRESVYGDFADVAGFKQARSMEIFQDRQKVLDMKVVDLTFSDRIEARLFSRP